MKSYTPYGEEDLVEIRQLMDRLSACTRPNTAAHDDQTRINQHLTAHAITYIGRLMATLENRIAAWDSSASR